ncbi:MAG: bifunctional folylpolyglutamate synthase/dihydrofolate synthase [Lachnospiraceae bacterium]|nr:bifunctional folylpolyglutamate synthase/dihydrofolate synthase [Lachnospiraceae bacterium]MDD3614632.1 bifunctional folylpolyglutamate synthase/dihydrofolate synthase [Lachnospiraceae bacterium]
MNYEEARAFIKDAESYGSVLGLGNMQEMAKRLGHPEQKLKFVHIAGTNGKGSVLAYVSTIIKEAGYKVGRYISPTIFAYRERLQVNGEYISREDFAECMGAVAEVIGEMTSEGLPHPTPFEIETMVGFVYFAMKKCDIVVLECGMGGATDATNIVTNTMVAVIAAISRDHVGFLGDTLEAIAQVKCGIIKKGCKVVYGRQAPEVEACIINKAKEEQCIYKGVDFHQLKVWKEDVTGNGFLYPASPKEWKERRELGGLRKDSYETSLIGSYQIENAALAIEAAYALMEEYPKITETVIKTGLKKAKWDGRFTIVEKNPYFIIDGAHNPDGAKQLATSLEKYFPGKKKIYIMGVFRDKEYTQVLETTAPLAQEIITIETPDNVRALPAEELAEAARSYHECVICAGDIGKAVELAKSHAGEDDVIVAFGSLSFLGQMVQCLENQKK